MPFPAAQQQELGPRDSLPVPLVAVLKTDTSCCPGCATSASPPYCQSLSAWIRGGEEAWGKTGGLLLTHLPAVDCLQGSLPGALLSPGFWQLGSLPFSQALGGEGEDEEAASARPPWWSTPERMRPDLSSLPPSSPPLPLPRSLTQLLLDTDLKPLSDWSQGGQVVWAMAQLSQMRQACGLLLWETLQARPAATFPGHPAVCLSLRQRPQDGSTRKSAVFCLRQVLSVAAFPVSPSPLPRRPELSSPYM